MVTTSALGGAQLVRVRALFRALGLSDRCGYRLVQSGEFPYPVTRLGGRYYVRAADLDAATRAAVAA